MLKSLVTTALFLLVPTAASAQISADDPRVAAACERMNALADEPFEGDCLVELAGLSELCPRNVEAAIVCLSDVATRDQVEGCITPCIGEAMAAMPDPGPVVVDDPLAGRDMSDPFRTAGRPTLGPADAPVTVVVFSDFQCPFCARAAGNISALEARYGERVRFVFKQFPLDFHPMARQAANASLAVAAQNNEAFWPYHDLLFAAQDRLSTDLLIALAEQVGVDPAPVREAIAMGSYTELIAEDMADATVFGVRGTPSFVINGAVVAGAQPVDALAGVIDSELAAIEHQLAAGVALDEAIAHRVELNVEAMQAPQVERAPEPVAPVDLDTTGAPALGPVDAAVELVVFGDFECPFCRRFAQTLNEVLAGYSGQVRLVSMQFPLPMHSHAMLASEAALAAHAQGRFWDLYPLLYAEGPALTRQRLETLANSIELDMDAFRAALDAHTYQPAIEAQITVGERASVRGTPAWFVNGVRYSGAVGADEVRQAIDAALAEE